MKGKLHYLDLVVYPIPVYITFHYLTATIQFPELLEFRGEDGMERTGGITANVIDHRDRRSVVICIPADPEVDDCVDIEVAAHEAAHAAFFVLEVTGVEFVPNGSANEAYAYLIGMINAEIHSRFFDEKKMIKAL